MNEGEKRLFFGFSIEEPWPHSYPRGRIIEENSRHLTLAFLGDVPFSRLRNALPQFPDPPVSLGPAGICDKLLFLTRVVAQHVTWLVDDAPLLAFQQTVCQWLETLGYPIDRRPLLPHITLARAPFVEKEWERWFEPLPCIVTGIHLYESIGNLTYHSLWEIPLTRPFEEIEHTADIAFHVKGKNPAELYLHAALALSFKYPPFLKFIETGPVGDLNQVIKELNRMIAQCDLSTGCPFKAVSYHTKLKQCQEGFINWEMIVDV
ncbi:MAG: hypothetical protein JSS30_03285 [Verrucomicrobia bacterium]|nr:hypothetical protein [Verrucomicrobiota bacterium]